VFALEVNDKPLPTAARVVGSFIGGSLRENVAVVYNGTTNKLVILVTVVYFNYALMQVGFIAGRAD
jgi:hypothetical protein